MKKILFILLLSLLSNSVFGQSIDKQKEFTSLKEALKNPENVFRLNLSNQVVNLTDEQWSMFVNLEYLSLKNDHLKEIPLGITKLKSLKLIDLSGNDFKQLPSEFSNLTNLEEVILNEEPNMNLPKTLTILSKLKNLKSLHLENDHLKSIPSEILKFKNLEYLFLNNNELETIPKIKTLDHLKYLDLKDNKIKPELQDMKNLNFGFKINF